MYLNNAGIKVNEYPPNYGQAQQPSNIDPEMSVIEEIPSSYPQKVQPQGINDNGTDMNDSIDIKLNDDEGFKRQYVNPSLQYQQLAYVP
jgi:hypothetical protein